MPKQISIDEVCAKRRDKLSGDVLRMATLAPPRSWNEEERSAVFVMSQEVVDSYGDIVVQSGINLDRFEKNPQAFFNHASRDLPIGAWSDVKQVRGSPKRTEGKMTFVAEGTDEYADRVARHVAAGSLRACSIGFMPKGAEWIEDDDGNRTWGIKFNEVELYECSVVTIPAVAGALAKGAQSDEAGYMSPEVIEEFLEHLKEHPEIAKMVDKSRYESVLREFGGNKSIIAMEPPEIEIKGLDQLEALTARMEAAAGIKSGDTAPVETVPPSDDDLVLKNIESDLMAAVEPLQERANDVVDDEKKSALLGIFDGIMKFIKNEPPEPEKATPEEKAALAARFKEYQTEPA